MNLTRVLAAVVFAGVTAALALAAEGTSLAGRWNLHYSISGNDGDLDCALSQTDKDITGTCKGEQGAVSVTGKLDGDKVTLQYKTEYNGDDLTVVYTGKLESPTKITGSVSVQPMGVDGDFTATQSK